MPNLPYPKSAIRNPQSEIPSGHPDLSRNRRKTCPGLWGILLVGSRCVGGKICRETAKMNSACSESLGEASWQSSPNVVLSNRLPGLTMPLALLHLRRQSATEPSGDIVNDPGKKSYSFNKSLGASGRTSASGGEGTADALEVLHDLQLLSRHDCAAVSLHAMLAYVQALLLFGFTHTEDANGLQGGEQCKHRDKRPAANG